ncbi:MAG: phosphotransferase family protein, partial [Candidatus Heimdallarchaeota archaeon]|nr:phosphotransferase family protein [Candidatus Heimdallarchaeota archaeon]
MIPSKHLQSDIIEVREDEKFNEEKLAEFLKDKLPNSKNPMKVKQFGGGAANLTYLLDFGDAEYVLRRPPLGPVAKGAHDMTREYRVLSVLHQDFPYAPRAHLFDDGAVIGSPFFIMDRRKGIVVRNKFPENFTDIPNAGRLISTSLIDRLAELHQVDYKKLNLEQLGKPEGFIERQVEGWYKRWNAAKHEDLKLMDELYLWLKSNYPNNPNYSIIHNDYKLDNVMIDSKDPGSIVAVFDWDMCTLGDPLSDLGALLAYWT